VQSCLLRELSTKRAQRNTSRYRIVSYRIPMCYGGIKEAVIKGFIDLRISLDGALSIRNWRP
jgi:hypothetical protein